MEERRKALFKHAVPECCETASIYHEWKVLARQSKPYSNEKYFCGFCSDCTPEYKNKMMELERCENTDIIFEIDKFGGLIGRFPGEISR